MTDIPAPISWAPSSYWDGNDGLWNSFIVQVGSPKQDFRILPSTAGQETWLPKPNGCATISPSDPGYCGQLRGALPIDGKNSSGFQNNQSSSWIDIGAYQAESQIAQLGYNINALYGFDTVVAGNDSNALSLDHQVVGLIPSPDVWLGQFGIGPKTINFTNFNDPIPCFMRNLVTTKKIASLSFGYTAGASYKDKTPASLTLGGYDANKFDQSSALSFDMNSDNSRPLQAGIANIIANIGGSTVNLLPSSTYHFIDSTVSHIWLPDDSIDAFVSSFGLTYDNNTDLFLINDTMRAKWQQENPTITFTLSGGSKSGRNGTVTQDIQLPYAAFDLQASYPYYQPAKNYFPIRRAANNTQYTIGRTFLQEAYVIADYDRQNFTIAQAKHDSTKPHLVAISESTTSSSPSSSPSAGSSKSSLSGGAIAGIVVGAIAALAILGAIVFFLMRRRRQSRWQVHEADGTAVKGEAKASNEYPAEPKVDPNASWPQGGTELSHDSALHEAPSRNAPVAEMAGRQREAELYSGVENTRLEMDTPLEGGNSIINEAPGHDAQRHELAGSSPRVVGKN